MNLFMQRTGVLVVAFFCLLFMACSKDSQAPVRVNQDPEITPIGQPVGEIKSVTIDVNGGELQTADGAITVLVPQGAVNAPVQLQVQQVTNNCSAGLGKTFRLLPHGTQFLKPVTIKISYGAFTDSIAAEDALGIAYQSDNGVWKMIGNKTIDKVNKAVSITTSHFSDWTLITWLKIKPVSSIIGVGEKQQLQVLNYFPINEDNDLLAPLTTADNSELPLGRGVAVPDNFVKSWSLAGVGTLKGNGGLATYTAPASVNGYADVTATATMASDNHQLLLLAHIRVLGDGMTFRINGGEWVTLEGGASKLDATQSGVSGTGDNISLAIIWPGGEGSFGWNHETNVSATALAYSPDGGASTIAAFYENSQEEMVPSGGSVKITKWANVGEYVTGTFTASPAGKFSVATGKQLGTVTIDGYFRLKRVI